MPVTRKEFAEHARLMWDQALNEDAKKTPAQHVIDEFLSYVELAHGSWDPTAEDDWQDFVTSIEAMLKHG